MTSNKLMDTMQYNWENTDISFKCCLCHKSKCACCSSQIFIECYNCGFIICEQCIIEKPVKAIKIKRCQKCGSRRLNKFPEDEEFQEAINEHLTFKESINDLHNIITKWENKQLFHTQCDKCNRKEVLKKKVRCKMTQPNGKKCKGIMRLINNKGDNDAR